MHRIPMQDTPPEAALISGMKETAPLREQTFLEMTRAVWPIASQVLRRRGRSEALVDVPLDLFHRNVCFVLALRFQRNCSAEPSGCAVLVLEAVQIVAVSGGAEAAAVAGYVFQRVG